MRYEVYDEDGKLFRKFWERADAEKFLQPGWKLVTKHTAKHGGNTNYKGARYGLDYRYCMFLGVVDPCVYLLC